MRVLCTLYCIFSNNVLNKFICSYTVDVFGRRRKAMKPDSDEDSEEGPYESEDDEWSQ